MKITSLILLTVLLALIACTNSTTQPTPGAPIFISSPANGAVLHDSPMIMAVSGNGTTFDRVVFLIDSDSVATDTIAPYVYQWSIFRYTSGSTHVLYAVGFRGDSTFISEHVTVTVQFSTGFSIVSVYRPSSMHAVGITNYGNALFISNAEIGLEMLDITNKALPTFLSEFNTPGQALHSDISFPYVFIADRDGGVESALFANVDSISPRYHYNTQSLAISVAASENYLFVAENDGLAVLSLPNLTAFSRLAFSQDLLKYIVARHDTAFIVGDNSFHIVDCTTPASPNIVSTYNNLNLARAVAIADTFAFIANGTDGVIALSIAHPASPRFLARFNPGLIMTSVSAGDGTLFAGANTGVVYALDYITTPGSIQILDQVNINALIEDIHYQAYYVYVAATSNVNILRFVP
jgi:hypothetical protein